MMAKKSMGWTAWAGALAALVLLAGCGGSDKDDAIVNKDPGNNNLNVVAAFGDSITSGFLDIVPYPRRLSPLIGKTVVNVGISGSKAGDNVGRTQTVIDRHRPAYMIILYGINDVIHSRNTSGILSSIEEMVQICENNKVLPILATYPMLNGSKYQIFAGGTARLNQGIRDIAKARGIKCVDLEKEFSKGRDPANPNMPLADASLYADGLHPNDAGTQIMALAFADLF